MTTLNLPNLSVESQLARAVQLTERLRQRSERRPLAGRVAAGVDFFARGIFHVWRHRRIFTPIKLANMAAINLQFLLKTERVIGRPYAIKIESTNICNTKCQLCPTGIGLQGRPKGKMTFERYTSLVDELKPYLVSLDLSMWGDPLIVPDIYKMIRYAHDQKVWTYISSNLHAFKPDKGQAEALVESGLDLLTCSLHGASQETYEHYQPGKSFEESVAKVKHILETRDRMGSKTPQVQLNFVVTRNNEHEVDAFRELAASLGCKAVFSAPALNTRFVGKDKNLVQLGMADDVIEKQKRDLIERWLPENDEYALPAYREMLRDDVDPQQWNGRKVYPCSWPWRQTVINWDGNISVCCGAFGEDEDLGNVFERPFGQVWNGKRYRMARRSFKRKVEDPQAGHPCTTCPGVML